jgi:modulator of FtsH protease HflK
MEYEEGRYIRIVPPQPGDVLRYAWIGIVAVLAIVLAYSSYYAIPTDSKGVVQRFGRFNRITDSGLHLKWPLIETVSKPQVERIFKAEFGYRTLQAGVQSTYGGRNTEESLMLCGDLSVADVQWIVQYQIGDPRQYLFNVRNPDKLIRDVAESVMRSVVGDSSVDEVLTSRRIEVNIAAEQKMQTVLDKYGSGISIVAVKLQDVNPPDKVKPAFNDVNASQQDKERLVNQALEEYNKVIPRARGEALQKIQQAEAYAVDRINTAQGDASRFNQIYTEYKQNEDVTRRRMYLENLGKVLPKIEKKYIVDEDVKGLLPLMQIGEN